MSYFSGTKKTKQRRKKISNVVSSGIMVNLTFTGKNLSRDPKKKKKIKIRLNTAGKNVLFGPKFVRSRRYYKREGGGLSEIIFLAKLLKPEL